MRAAGDNQTRAAELLGISRDQLRYRLDKFGLRAGSAAD
jgi:DNA-binding protein Fis